MINIAFEANFAPKTVTSEPNKLFLRSYALF